MKIVIYGTGKIFEQYRQFIRWEYVVAIVDQKAENGLYGDTEIPVYNVTRLGELVFDYIAVFSNVYFDEIKTKLITCYNIAQDKIVSWRIFREDNTDWNGDRQLIEFYERTQQCTEGLRILDVGMKYLPRMFLSRYSFCRGRNIQVDGIGKQKAHAAGDLYSNIYSDSEQIKGCYDEVFLWEDHKEYIDAASILRLNPKNLYFYRPYDFGNKGSCGFDIILQKYDVVECSLLCGRLSVFKRKEEVSLQGHIYVVTHKETFAYEDDMYRPLCVGRQYKNPKYLCASAGENIEYLNDRINECTALYWIWKNTKTEFVGINHYRRYFYDAGMKVNYCFLRKSIIAEVLFQGGYDIILPELTRLGVTLAENIQLSVGNELYEKGLDVIRKVMWEHQPQYMEAFEYVINLKAFYACHMFVAKRSVFEAYCEWLFSFLIDAAELLDVTQNTPHEKRTIGFFAELMPTVWCLKKRLRVFELPVMKIGEI